MPNVRRIIDLPALLVAVREAVLMSAAMTRYAADALRREGWTKRTRRLVRRAETFARAAMLEARAAHEAVTLATTTHGDPS